MTECILASRVNSQGRPTKLIESYRRAWEEVHGPIPKGMDIHHKCCEDDLSCEGGTSCKHRGCRNVEHLRLLTRSENLRLSKLSQELRDRRGQNFKDKWDRMTEDEREAWREQGRVNAAKRWSA